MSDQTSRSTGTKAQGKKASGNSHPAATAGKSKSSKLKSATAKLAAKRLAKAAAVTTIHVSFPTPSVVSCPSPFQAMGTAASTTQMSSTAVIHTPNGQLIGTLDANPPPPFTWSYTFPDPPQGVPLSLVVTGTTSMGTQDQVVVPFQCQ
jgi:hypothetical protein